MPEIGRTQGFASAVYYRDAKAAYLWLERAFGFEPRFAILDETGALSHAELGFGTGVVMIGPEWLPERKSPQSLGGINSQSVHVQLAPGADIDAHCAHAHAAGAEILMQPEEQFYGDRIYRARDPEGHIWTFRVTSRAMSPQEWDSASGMTTRKRLD